MNFKNWLENKEWMEVSGGHGRTSIGRGGGGRGLWGREQRPHFMWGGLGHPEPGKLAPDASGKDVIAHTGKRIGAELIGNYMQHVRAHADPDSFMGRASVGYPASSFPSVFGAASAKMRELQCPRCQQKFPAPPTVQTGDVMNCPKCDLEFQCPAGIKRKEEPAANYDDEGGSGGDESQVERWQQFDIPELQKKTPEEINRLLQDAATKRRVVAQIIQDLQTSDGRRWAGYEGHLNLSVDPQEDNIQYFKTYQDDQRQLKNSIIVKRKY